MLSNRKLTKDGGFTIIEVMIVLAIAALILVVVLVAIPQLQRNQRNSARQNEASRILVSVQNWSANNNGAVFSASNRGAVITDVGSLSQYTLTTTSPATFLHATGEQTGTITDVDRVRIVTGAACSIPNPGQTVNASSRSLALQFAVETANGTQSRCISS
jgi:prepilin-type N-terminal cleavage/methylation domain-containing protein